MGIEEVDRETGGGGSDAGRRSSGGRGPVVDMLLGIVGGVAGAILGYFLVFAIARQGFYAIILPGALLDIWGEKGGKDERYNIWAGSGHVCSSDSYPIAVLRW